VRSSEAWTVTTLTQGFITARPGGGKQRGSDFDAANWVGVHTTHDNAIHYEMYALVIDQCPKEGFVAIVP
jgi:hypothetical protein